MNNHATVQSSTPVSAAPLLQVSGALIAIIKWENTYKLGIRWNIA